MINILIHPQRIKITAMDAAKRGVGGTGFKPMNEEREQQDRVRDFI